MKLEHTYNLIISYDMVWGNQLSQYEDLRSISRTCSKKYAWHGSVPLSLKYWRDSERTGHMGSLTSQPNMCVSLLVPETSFQKQSGHKCALVHRCTHAHMHAHTQTISTRTWSSSSHKEHKHISSLFYLKRKCFIHAAETAQNEICLIMRYNPGQMMSLILRLWHPFSSSAEFPVH